LFNADKCRSVPDHLALSLGSTDDPSGSSEFQARYSTAWPAFQRGLSPY